MVNRNKIRVVHLIDTLDTGGAENVVMTLARFMNKQKFDVEIWCLRCSDVRKAEMNKCGVSVKTVPLRRFWTFYPLYKLTRFMAKERPVILHTHLVSGDIKGRICGRLAQVPIIVSTYHNFYSYKEIKNTWNRIQVLLDNVTARLFCDKIAVVSKRVAELHIGAGTPQEKLQIIPNPVDTDRFKSQSGPNEVDSTLLLSDRFARVITVARLVPVKGIDVLMRAAFRVLKRYPQTKFTIVGDGPLRKELELQIGKMDLNGSVVLAGERHDIVGLLRASDLFVLPSLSEGVPVSVLEAMSAGLPVVATEVGGNPDIIVNYETGILVPSGDADALADAICMLLGDPARFEAMGRRARERAKRLYSVETVVRQTENLYFDLAKSKRLI
ncbi:MAG: glycosyltransferase [Candidatus Hodarchaeota archaeon]